MAAQSSSSDSLHFTPAIDPICLHGDFVGRRGTLERFTVVPDTGADGSCMNENLARRVMKQGGFQRKNLGNSSYYLVSVDGEAAYVTEEISQFEWKISPNDDVWFKFDVGIVPKGWFQGKHELFLGVDFLTSRSPVTFDYVHNRVRLTHDNGLVHCSGFQRPVERRACSRRRDLDEDDGMILLGRTSILANGDKTRDAGNFRIEIDTGSSISCMTPGLAADAYNKGYTMAQLDEPNFISAGSTSLANTHLGLMENFAWHMEGQGWLANVRVESVSARDSHMLLGVDFLRYYSPVTFDFRQKTLQLTMTGGRGSGTKIILHGKTKDQLNRYRFLRLHETDED